MNPQPSVRNVKPKHRRGGSRQPKRQNRPLCVMCGKPCVRRAVYVHALGMFCDVCLK